MAVLGLAAAIGVGVWIFRAPPKSDHAKSEPVLPKASPEAKGRALFKQWSCQSCHLDVDSDTGSALKGLPGTTVELSDGSKVVIDGAFLKESILEPTAKVRKGFDPVMPEYKGRLTAAEVDQLVAYLLVRK